MAVTFVKKAGNDMDAATVMAAAAVDAGGNYSVNDMAAGTQLFNAANTLGQPAGASTFTYNFNGKLNVTVQPGQVVQLYFNAVTVDGPVDVLVDYQGSLGASVALLSTNFADLSYMFAGGALESGAARLVASFDNPAGAFYPVLQLAGGAAAATVSFDNLRICAKPCVPMKGQQVTKFFTADPFAGDFSGGLDGAYQDVNAQADTIGFNAPQVVDGAVELSAAGTSLSNITLSALLSGPALVRISCDAKVVASAGGGANGLFQFVGGSQSGEFTSFTNFGTFVAAGTLGSSWSTVSAECPVQSAALDLFTVTAQAAIGIGDPAADTLTIAVDNIAVSVVDTNPAFFDATLLGS
jgi:hypothetical protein